MIFLGYKYRRVKKMPLLTEEQKIERYQWCLRHQNFNFDNYIFVDETSIRNLEVPLYNSRLPSSYPPAIESSSKYRTKVNLWAGISKRGPTNFFVSFIKILIS